MVVEHVREIRKAEEQAEGIIKRGEEKALELEGSLSVKLEEFRKQEEIFLADERTKHRESSEAKTEEAIKALEREYLRKEDSLKRKSAQNIPAAAETAWEEIKKELFTR